MNRFSLYHATFFLLFLGFAGFIYSVMQTSSRAARSSNCFAHLKQIGLAMQAYTRDHDGHYPIAARWTDDLQPYIDIGEIERTSRQLDRAMRCATTSEFYVLNEFLAGAKPCVDFAPATIPLAFCVRTGERNLTDNGSLWPREPIHEMGSRSGNIVVFADAHVVMMESKPQFHGFELGAKTPRREPKPTN